MRFFVLFVVALVMFVGLCSLFLLGCGEGRVGLITDDVVRDAAGCYESVDVVEDSYLVALDKSCVDLALSDFVIEATPTPAGELPAVREWSLLATLERDVRQRFWHQFHIQPDVEQSLFRAYLEGRDFLFLIERAEDIGVSQGEGFVRTAPIQFYFHQPEVPIKSASLFFPSSHWFEQWGPDKHPWSGATIDREESGFVARFSVVVNRAGEAFLSDIEFGATRDGLFWDTGYQPHIRAENVLRVFVR